MTDFDVFALQDDWETLADAGRAVMDDMDSGRWLAGDIACRVARRYGDDSLSKFAAEIGMARASTLRDYLRVSRFYEPVARATYQGVLSWTHYRTCMRAGDLAGEWLERANDNGWPIAELDRQMKAAIGAPVPPRKLWEGAGMLYVDRHSTTVIELVRDDLALDLDGARVRVIVYAIEAEAEAEHA